MQIENNSVFRKKRGLQHIEYLRRECSQEAKKRRQLKKTIDKIATDKNEQ